MKVLSQNYSFNPISKTVTINDFSNLKLEQFLIITNVKTNQIIYNFADTTSGGIINNGNILTLDFDTSGMSSNDGLQIFLDIVDPNVSNNEVLHLLKRVVKLMESNATVDSANRQRVTVENSSVTATLSTTGGANVTGIGASIAMNPVGGNPYSLVATPIQAVTSMIDERWKMMNDARNTYANGIRRNLN